MFASHTTQFKSLPSAMKWEPEHCKELIEICHDIYDAIAMDAFGINGAASKADYVSVIADHLSWSEDSLMSYEARSLYTALTSTARDELVGRAYLAMNGGER